MKPKEMTMPIKTTPGEVIFVTEDRVNLKANGFKGVFYGLNKFHTDIIAFGPGISLFIVLIF